MGHNSGSLVVEALFFFTLKVSLSRLRIVNFSADDCFAFSMQLD